MKRLLLPLISLIALLVAVESQAAITFIAGASANATGTSITPSEPAGCTEDDWILSIIQWAEGAGDGGTITDPADFTQIDQFQDAVGGDVIMYAGWKKRAATAGNGYNFTIDESAVGAVHLTCFRGVDTSTPFDVTYVKASHYTSASNTPNLACKAITTNTDGARVLCTQNTNDAFDTGNTCGAPTNYTVRHGAFLDLNARGFCAVDRDIATAGLTTPTVFTHADPGALDDPRNFTFALLPAASGPTFSSGPSVAAATDGYTISGTITGENATVYAIGLNPGASAPADCDAVEAYSSPPLSANEAWTADGADSFTMTASGAWPDHDVYVCAEGASGDTAVSSFADERRSADTDQTIVELTSVSSTSPFGILTDTTGDPVSGSPIIGGMTDISFISEGMLVDVSAGFTCSPCIVEAITATTITLEENAGSNQTNVTVGLDAYYSPSVAAGDVVEGDDTNSITGTMTVAVDGDISCATTCGTAFTWDYNIQDTSDTSDGDFDSGPPAWVTSDDTIAFNSVRPEFDLSQFPVPWDKDVAISFDLDDFCTDPQSYTTDFTLRSGTWPTGVSLNGSTGVVDGTPTVEDESGVALMVTCASEYGIYSIQNVTAYVVDTVTMPDITGDTIVAGITTLGSSYPWSVGEIAISVTAACSPTVSINDIISQVPAASAETAAAPSFSAVVSTGPLCSSQGLKMGIKGPRIGL